MRDTWDSEVLCIVSTSRASRPECGGEGTDRGSSSAIHAVHGSMEDENSSSTRPRLSRLIDW